MSAIQSFIDAWPLFRESVLSGTIAGAVLGLLGVYIVLRRMVFLSAALSQTAGLGVTLAFWAQIHLGIGATLASPSIGATLLALLVIALLLTDRTPESDRRDAYLGLAFLLGSSGTLIVGTQIVQEIQDIETLLFGTAVAVLPEDFTQLVVVSVVLAVLHLWWRRGFVAVAMDRTDAMVRGLPVRVLEIALLGSLAVGISVTTRILGALPAFAFSVLPAMAALQLVANVHRGLVLAALFGAMMGFVGYFVAYVWDFPVGASQTIVGVVLYAACQGAKQFIDSLPRFR
jgi:zinc transport system permease protein